MLICAVRYEIGLTAPDEQSAHLTGLNLPVGIAAKIGTFAGSERFTPIDPHGATFKRADVLRGKTAGRKSNSGGWYLQAR